MQELEGNCMPMMGYPNQYSPMTMMPEQQLESMYPKTYCIIQPVVEKVCENMMMTCCPMKTITNDQLESMIDDVYGNVEKDVVIVIEKDSKEERQLLGGRRRLLRDFIGALLITSLIRRRPFPYNYGYPGYYGGGYGGGYGGYGPFGGYPGY